MEATVLIALISGALSLAGIAMNVMKDLRKNRNDTALAANSASEVRASRIDEKYDRYIQQLEARETAALQRFDAAQSAWAEERGKMQSKYQEAIQRLELLESQRTRDQACIQQLQEKIERLEESR